MRDLEELQFSALTRDFAQIIQNKKYLTIKECQCMECLTIIVVQLERLLIPGIRNLLRLDLCNRLNEAVYLEFFQNHSQLS